MKDNEVAVDRQELEQLRAIREAASKLWDASSSSGRLAHDSEEVDALAGALNGPGLRQLNPAPIFEVASVGDVFLDGDVVPAVVLDGPPIALKAAARMLYQRVRLVAVDDA